MADDDKDPAPSTEQTGPSDQADGATSDPPADEKAGESATE